MVVIGTLVWISCVNRNEKCWTLGHRHMRRVMRRYWLSTKQTEGAKLIKIRNSSCALVSSTSTFGDRLKPVSPLTVDLKWCLVWCLWRLISRLSRMIPLCLSTYSPCCIWHTCGTFAHKSAAQPVHILPAVMNMGTKVGTRIILINCILIDRPYTALKTTK